MLHRNGLIGTLLFQNMSIMFKQHERALCHEMTCKNFIEEEFINRNSNVQSNTILIVLKSK